ncbi:hypothetical protein D3C74_420930 [compost metagenome]
MVRIVGEDRPLVAGAFFQHLSVTDQVAVRRFVGAFGIGVKECTIYGYNRLITFGETA